MRIQVSSVVKRNLHSPIVSIATESFLLLDIAWMALLDLADSHPAAYREDLYSVALAIYPGTHLHEKDHTVV